jgi:RNA polymerase sigma-70 factor, ECF subfamily
MAARTPESDEALYHRLRREGDLAAFDQLYQRYERRLFGFLRGFLSERADTEEVFHDAFLQVLASREVSFAAGSFAAWLYKIARNLALNRVRGGRRAAQATAALTAGEVVATAEQPDAQLDARVQRQALARAVGELPPVLAEVYQLRVGGMSYEEIAFALEVPLGTVKSRMHELCDRLKTGVSRWMKPPT